MPICHPIFTPLRRLIPVPCLGDFGQPGQVPLIGHFQIDTDAPIEGGAGTVDIQIGDADLDDLR